MLALEEEQAQQEFQQQLDEDVTALTEEEGELASLDVIDTEADNEIAAAIADDNRVHDSLEALIDLAVAINGVSQLMMDNANIAFGAADNAYGDAIFKHE